VLNEHASAGGRTALPPEAIAIRGAREHNLKNVSVDIPRDKFVVITGVSGSGKSTLAFDLLFAEGQRRFLDSMSAYSRQFVEQLGRPDVDLISGLPPSVSIEQNVSRGGGKSTVATVTEIHQFVRLLFARLGTQYCPDCEIPVRGQTRDALQETLESDAAERGDLTLLAPVVKNRKGFHSDIAAWAVAQGFTELRADGRWYDPSKLFRLDRFKEHDIEVVVGTLEAKPKKGTDPRARAALIEKALEVGKGVMYALDRLGQLTVHSTERACPKCSRSFAALDPKQFSYNSSQGWCPKCRGFGELFHLPDVDRGADAESIEESWWRWQEGKREACPECHGSRLRPEARAVHLDVHTGATTSLEENTRKRSKATAEPGPTLDQLGAMSVDAALAWVTGLQLDDRSTRIARDILPEIRERLRFLAEVGLGYLQLGRGVTTLSGGEAQRIRLAAQLGSNLSGVLYILDEPTIGLHPRDNDQLLDSLTRLRNRGNSLVVVEHDEATMRRADWILDLGPGAGVRGGEVVAAGTLADLLKNPNSITGRCLAAPVSYPSRGSRRPVPAAKDAWLTLHDAAVNNLKQVTVKFPLGRFVAVTGVSGSGKSTLVKECLYPAVQAALAQKPGGRKPRSGMRVSGIEAIQAVHEVDQSPIGRTPRSTPATYVGFFDRIRELFASTQESKMRGYSASRFSFNSVQGRCPECDGAGSTRLEMNFLPGAEVRCETCRGRRFNPETLDVLWNGKSIADVLDLSVGEALEFFSAHSLLKRPLEALRDTGLDYLRLGQTSPTLSGGEAQRIKLVSHLLTGLRSASAEGRMRASKPDLFILEEPTIGLHIEDVRRLVEVIQRLVDGGHTVVVIEHNLDLIAEADWVIDLGPEGGGGGGTMVAEGSPEAVATVSASHTGRYLQTVLPKPESDSKPAQTAKVGAKRQRPRGL
jgi:excinuclease ABC subunit A